MLLQLGGIFLNVVTPVFALVLIGSLAGRWLALETRTLTRFAYYLLTPAFVFNIIGKADVSAALAVRMIGFIAVVKTPALIALPFALFFNATGGPPLFLERITGLLGAAMVPTMLVTLGVQLTQMKDFRFSADMFIASGVRLLGGPLLAFLLVIPFGLAGLERGAGILQASMPSAVLASIIALEHDLLPDFVTPTVLLSTLLSLVTLTGLMVVI